MGSLGFRANLLGVGALDPSAPAAAPCGDAQSAWLGLLRAELSLAGSASVSWYPTLADMAGSADVGFTVGPWRDSDDARGHGQFLSVWRRDSACRWRLAVDAGTTFGSTPLAEVRLLPDQATFRAGEAPPPLLLEEDALGKSVIEFQAACREDGVAAALRTYARNGDFLLLWDDTAPMGLKQADLGLTATELSGTWRESEKGGSADATLAYSIGSMLDERHGVSRRGVQVWQFDSKVANWGLRILLIGSADALSK